MSPFKKLYQGFFIALRNKYILLTFFIIYFIFMCVTYNRMVSRKSGTTEMHNVKYRPLGPGFHKIVHLDLKGAPPRMQYLLAILPQLKEDGATGLLIEYEDMFPYEGKVAKIKSNHAYSKDELASLLNLTQNLELEVIPLIQTLGHLEFLLKYDDFKDIREKSDEFRDICVSKNKSYEILSDMLSQVIQFHSTFTNLKWIHIGCDEIININKCSDCLKRKQTSNQLFADHVKRMASFVQSINTRITSLIWDDMIRRFSPAEFEEFKLQNYVELVVWAYAKKIHSDVQYRSWYGYSTVFNNIWAASAFKGADDHDSLITNIRNRYRNNYSWLCFMKAINPLLPFMSNLSFRGIFLTGWSRFNHNAPLYEVFPVGLPSLILNLYLINNLENESNLSRKKRILKLETRTIAEWLGFLKCPYYKQLRLKSNNVDQFILNRTKDIHICKYNGSSLYKDFLDIRYLEQQATYLNPIDIKTSEKDIQFLFKKVEIFEKILLNTKESLKKHLSLYFDFYVYQEIESNRLNQLSTFFKILKQNTKLKLIHSDTHYIEN